MPYTFPKVSICAVEHVLREDFYKFISDIPKYTKNPYEIVISDNSEDGSISKYLNSLKNDKIKVITNRANIGLGKGMNLAMKKAQCEYILRCDTDIDIKEEWDQKLIECYEKHSENVGIVGTYSYAHGNQIDMGDYINTDILITYCMLIPRKTIDYMNNFYSIMNDDSISTGEYLNGGGGYADPNYFYGFEDFDYSLAVRWSGKDLAMIKDVVAIHKEASNKAGWNPNRDAWANKSANYFRAKWSRLCNFWDVDKTYGLKTGINGWATLWGTIPINTGFMKIYMKWLYGRDINAYKKTIEQLKTTNDWCVYDIFPEFHRGGV